MKWPHGIAAEGLSVTVVPSAAAHMAALYFRFWHPGRILRIDHHLHCVQGRDWHPDRCCVSSIISSPWILRIQGFVRILISGWHWSSRGSQFWGRCIKGPHGTAAGGLAATAVLFCSCIHGGPPFQIRYCVANITSKCGVGLLSVASLRDWHPVRIAYQTSSRLRGYSGYKCGVARGYPGAPYQEATRGPE